jgi:hypothetical protein
MNSTQPITDTSKEHSEIEYSTYDLFILVISILSLLMMIFYYVPVIGQTETTIALALDTVFSFIFLYDFFRSLSKAPDRWVYFKKGGWLDLLGSIPAITIFRIFRIARLIRIIRTMLRIKLSEVWKVYKENQAVKDFTDTIPMLVEECFEGWLLPR